MRIKLYTTLILVFFLASQQMVAQCSLTVTGMSPVLCYGASDGSLTLSVGNGAAPYSFTWTGPQSGSANSADATYTINNLPAGVYTIVVFDNQGCSAETEGVVTQFAELNLSVAVTNLNCNGSQTGSINLSVSGGAASYFYQWSNTVNTQDQSGLGAGVYTVTVTDVNGCSQTTSATINQPQAITINKTITNVSCNGSSNGAITLAVSGGVPNYAYQWSNNQSTPNLNGIPAGTYTVTITDSNGCSKTTSATVSQPTSVTAFILPTAAICLQADGALDLQPAGGTLPYQYLWSNGATAQDLTGLLAGNYTVTVTDAKGCTRTNTANVKKGPDFTLSFANTPSNCNESVGASDLTVNGGTGPFTYVWSTGQVSEDIGNIPGGFYAVTVTSADGCSAIGYTFVGNANGPQLTLTQTGAGCFGSSTGSIDLTVTGGTPGYNYYWSTGNSTQDMNNLLSGTYIVTVEDATGCINSGSIFVGQNPEIVLSAVVTPVSCLNPNSGAINLSVTGGSPPYTYNWTTSQNTQDISNLPAGAYTCTVTDGAACTQTITVTVQVSPPMVLNTAVTDISCYGAKNGAVNLGISGGTPPYSAFWSNFSTTHNINNLDAGTYCVTVSDNVGCTQTTCATVKEPGTLYVTYIVLPAACSGAADGAIDITAGGGVPDYTYVWSTNDASADLTGLLPGEYTVTVTDVNGCTRVQSITVPVAASPIVVAAAATPASACGTPDGALNFDLENNATAPYSYVWDNGSNTGSQNNIAAEPFNVGGLSAGVYAITITTASGCSVTAEQTVGSPMSLTASTVAISNCFAADGSISLDVNGAAPDYTYQWASQFSTGSGNNISTSPFSITGLAAGEYAISVTNAEGCFAKTTATIGQSDTIGLSAVVTPVPCFGQATGAVDLTVTGGVPPYSYLWSPGINTEDVSGLVAGKYTVTVSDVNFCSAQLTVMIMGPDPIILQLTPAPIACNGASTGSIDLEVAGGFAPFTYNWNNSETDQDIFNLSAGIYTVTVTDAGGCTQTGYTYVNQAGPTFSVSASGAPASGCLAPDGLVTVTVTNGAPDYAYAWSNGITTGTGAGIASSPFDITGLASGLYMITITNGDGCTSTASAVVGGNLFDAILSSTPASCAGVTNGSILVSINTGGVPPYSYQWSSGAQSGNAGGINTSPFSIPNLPGGSYTVTISNAAGCSMVRQVSVSTNSMTFTASVSSPNCSSGVGNININVNSAGSIPPFGYAWASGTESGSGSSASEPFNIAGLAPGAYTITVTNALGCSAIKNTTIAVGPGSFNMSVSSTQPTCFGGANGSLNLNIIGGSTPPYTYQWSNGITNGAGNSNTEPFAINGLSAGNYNVTVTDNSGCSGSVSQTVSQPAAPVVSNEIIMPTCGGQTNGGIALTYTAPNGPHTFQWSGPGGFTSTQKDLSGLGAGDYSLTVTNSLGCTYVHTTVQLPDAEPVTVTIASAGCGTNAAVAVAANGIPPYLYHWSNNVNYDTLVFTGAGLYGVTATDNRGCTAVSSEFLQPDNGSCGLIGGSVMEDIVNDCLPDGEPPLAGWLVKAMGAKTYYALTGPDGQFLFQVEPGDYTLEVVPPDPVWLPCLNTTTVSVTQPNVLVDAGVFMVGRQAFCPALYVKIGTTFLRRCSNNNFYQIEYCNNGTAPAENAYLEVVLDPFMAPLDASRPYTNLGNQLIRFDLGTLAPGACGAIVLRVYLNCNAVLGQTHCTEAHIYPDTLCLPSDPNWSGASIGVRGECATGQVRFIVKNTGTGDLNSALDYIVIEDHVMLMKNKIDVLPVGDSIPLSFPANGSTWRLEIEQEALHPGLSHPSATIEGCTTTGSFSKEFVNQFAMDDQGPWLDINCQQNIGSWDPNDKQGFPSGYGSEHYIRPGTEIEYLIRFQNTGTDTAFQVHILDTLSAWLDPATFRPGTSSHPYRYDLFGTGILRFDFMDIMLPDSNVNEPASHGFVQFSIYPRDTTPLETVVENQAAIYFDFNDPVYTNTTRHKLGENFIVSGSWHPFNPAYSLRIAPNPVPETAWIEITGVEQGIDRDLHWILSDQTGKVVRTITDAGTGWQLKRGDLPPGMYFIRVENAGILLGTGKVLLK